MLPAITGRARQTDGYVKRKRSLSGLQPDCKRDNGVDSFIGSAHRDKSRPQILNLFFTRNDWSAQCGWHQGHLFDEHSPQQPCNFLTLRLIPLSLSAKEAILLSLWRPIRQVRSLQSLSILLKSPSWMAISTNSGKCQPAAQFMEWCTARMAKNSTSFTCPGMCR